MISHITGLVKSSSFRSIVIETGSLGFSVLVPDSELFSVNTTVTLCTYLHWNQEQGPLLFGFAQEVEKTVFLLILECSGIGPKIGLAVLAQLGAQQFLQIVQAEDCTALAKVNGIGLKKSEQMIVQLKHKITKLISSGQLMMEAGQSEHWRMITQALEALHYSRSEISSALQNLQKQGNVHQASFDQILRQALAFLAMHAR